MPKSALTIATAFLNLSEPERGDALTNLKLQKLLYYAQGFCLAIYKRPLFAEKICAWEHGPVVPEVYHQYKGYGANVIVDPIISGPDENLSEEEIDLISEVNTVYGQFSGWKLRDMTHSESPWLETEQSAEITHEKLLSFFTGLVNN